MKIQTTLLGKRLVMQNTWILTLERKDLPFIPGQYIHLSSAPGGDRREYSIYSTPEEETLEVLVKLQQEGEVSPRLCGSPPGTKMEMEGPGGEFILGSDDRSKPVVMIATGSGISPFASLVRSYPGLDYRILHGLPHPDGLKEFGFFAEDRYLQCTSRHPQGAFHGRVTDYLSTSDIPGNGIFMLCGNSDMIYEVMGILRMRGINPQDIRAEIYF